jgi:CHAT domain-containing protein/tetratricopeptide (TPR) repeat protein
VTTHPDPRLLAAHAERRLLGDEAARMDEHVAECSECYEVFAETVQFGLAEGEEAGVMRTGAGAAAPSGFLRRPAFRTVAPLAMAALLLLAVGLWSQRARFQRAPLPLVAQLAEAMGTRRFVEPRLTGGFRHGRLTTMRSGDTPQGLDAQSPAVLSAVARIRERAEGDISPESLGALGVTYLVSGDAAAAVKSLESASAQKPDDARLLSDLAAAYLVRAAQSDEPADIPKALESAERAIVLKDPPPEAYFNRALALERLHLVDAARKAWGDYLQRDSSSGWADEARQHLEALPKARHSSAEEDKARARAAIEGGQPAIDRLADESPSLLRDYFEDELLPAWADAYLVGRPDAVLYRERARVVGDALLRTTTDAMPRDAASALAEPVGASSRDPFRSQALGYQSLREAKRLEDLQEPPCVQFRSALRDLNAGGTGYAAWATEELVSACFLESEHPKALAELDGLAKMAEPRAYAQLLGHVRWLQALIHARRGELTESLDLYHSASVAFGTTRDIESQAAVSALTAENLHLLGERRGAWHDRRQGLALLSDVKNPRRRQTILSDAVATCLDDRMPRSALHFETALVEGALRWSRALVIAEALFRRAAIHHELGRDDLAASDMRESRQWIARVPDKSVGARQQAQADATEGEIFLEQQPEAAARSLGLSLAHFRNTSPALVPGLHLLLARAQLARGLDDVAENELLAGIEALEHARISLRDAALQVSFFDQALPLFDDMVRLQVTRRHDPERALVFVERGHARQLVDSMAGAAATPLDPEALRRELPNGLALVYYVPLEDRLFAWALTREGCRFVERSLPAAELSRLVAAHRAAIEGRAPQDVVRRTAARLHDELVRPLLPFIGAQRALIFIPAGIVQSVAFAGIWNRQTGRYLVEDHLLGIAPSGTVFVRASTNAAAPHGLATRVLVVGNPQLDRRRWPGFSNLPGAEAEADEIARLYPRSVLLTGMGATKAAFLNGARSSQLVHYAGHAATSADAPSTARLLLAPDPRTGDSGALYLHELDSHGLPRTRVVILAACRTAAGTVSRVEGALSLGRPFLAAGVPYVVASLWDIDDSVSRRFFITFHRALLAEGDPVLALRAAQIALLNGDDTSLAHPASWAAFICMGGLDPHSLDSLSKGDLS